MKTEKIIMNEQGFSPEQASRFLLQLIGDQITNYNEQQMSAWERNHLISRKENEAKITYLKEQKTKLIELLQEADASTESVDFVFSLDVVVRTATPVASN